MKFSLNELKEHTSINFIYDYSKEISAVIDILSIEPAKINGEIYYGHNELKLDISVDVNMELACSKTLKPVPYEMHFDAEILFSDTLEADFPLTDPLELTDIIFGYIVSEKPYTIYHPDAKDIIFEEEKRPHPAFAELDKNMKK
ncbi:MAG: DUF177 domain-containing protein [Tenericutes bacterium]|jgi:uncharacterized metal-binding protein YceD (DUF177 family)|nr:DUF177 domain-containing protein [Mycoplasmatota bacterium]